MSDNRKHDELAGILLHQLRNLIDGNQARAGEVVPGQYEAEDFCVRLLVLWSFSGAMEDSVTAGDASMADHFGYNSAAFARHSGELSERAACDTDLRAGFMDRLRAAGGSGVIGVAVRGNMPSRCRYMTATANTGVRGRYTKAAAAAGAADTGRAVRVRAAAGKNAAIVRATAFLPVSAQYRHWPCRRTRWLRIRGLRRRH